MEILNYTEIFIDISSTQNIFVMCTIFLGLLSSRKNFLISILVLEITLIFTFLSYINRQNIYGEAIAAAQIILIFGAIETSIGLSLLVDITRNNGSDMLNSNTSQN